MIKKKAQQSIVQPSQPQEIVKAAAKETLDLAAQKICPGFYPNRVVDTDWSLSPEERLKKARELFEKYQAQGISPPPALLVLL